MWCARFSESQVEVLKGLIKAQGELGPDLEGALEALELSRWDDLPEAELPWHEVTEKATHQGVSEADVVWDMAGRKKEPPAPRSRSKSASKGKRSSPKRARRSATPPGD
jgi:hypothetical protein